MQLPLSIRARRSDLGSDSGSPKSVKAMSSLRRPLEPSVGEPPCHRQQALGGKNLGVGKSGGAGMAYRPLQLLMAWGVLPPAWSVREPVMGTCGLIAGS
jgi:hypothetical protein